MVKYKYFFKMVAEDKSCGFELELKKVSIPAMLETIKQIVVAFDTSNPDFYKVWGIKPPEKKIEDEKESAFDFNLDEVIIKNTQIPVWLIIKSLKLGYDSKSILAAFIERNPSLKETDIENAKRYYYQHIDEINKKISENENEEDINGKEKNGV